MEGMFTLHVLTIDQSSGQKTSCPVIVTGATQIQQICDQLNSYLSVNNYGLFVVGQNDTSTGQWLEPNSTISECHINSETSVEFRKKVSMLSIRLLDGTLKRLNFDQSLPVHELLSLICGKIGIVNSEEYDLLLETDVKQASPPTLTSIPDKSFRIHPSQLTFRNFENYQERKEEQRMVKLKSRLVTDDDVKWLDHNLTLAEQGVGPLDILLLKRRFFYSDSAVQLDPVQLNLLYVQCREDILNGAHPVTSLKAVEFAGLQAQVDYGDFNEQKKEFDVGRMFPQALVKPKKGMGKKELAELRMRVQVEWRTHNKTTEMEAKSQYVRLAQSLKTYGVAFFLVKEKAKMKNKMVPILFGVAKDTVMRMDARSKETLQTWQIITIQRWKTTENTFSLDFGDSEVSYSMQTKEGRQIAKLIAGYLDLIRKRMTTPDSLPDYETVSQNSQIADNDLDSPRKMAVEMVEGYSPLQNSEMADDDHFDLPKTATIGTGEVVMKRQTVESGHVAMPGILRDTMGNQQLLNFVLHAQGRVAKILADLAKPMHVSEFLNYSTATANSDEEIFELSKKEFGIHMQKMESSVGQLLILSGSRNHDQNRAHYEELTKTMIDELDELTLALRKMSFTKRGCRNHNELLQQGEALCRNVDEVLSTLTFDEQQAEQVPLTMSRRTFLSSIRKLSKTSKQLTNSVENLDTDQPTQVAQEKAENMSFIEQIGLITAQVVRKSGVTASEMNDERAKKQLIAAASNLGQRSLDCVTLLTLARITSSASVKSEKSECAMLAIQSMHDLQAALVHLQSLWANDIPGLGESGCESLKDAIVGGDSLQVLIDNILSYLSVKDDRRTVESVDPVSNSLIKINQLMRSVDEELMSHCMESDSVSECQLNAKTIEQLQDIQKLLGETTYDSLEDLVAFLEKLVYESQLDEPVDLEVRSLMLNHVKTILENGYHLVSLMTEKSAEQCSNSAFLESQLELVNVADALICGDAFYARFRMAMESLFFKLAKSALLDDATSDISDERIAEIWEDIGESITQIRILTRDMNFDACCGNRTGISSLLREIERLLTNLLGQWVELVESGAVAEEEFRDKFHAGLVSLLGSGLSCARTITSYKVYVDEKAFGKARRDLLQQIDTLQKIYKSVNCGTESCQHALSTIFEVDEELETAITFALAGSAGLEMPSSGKEGRFHVQEKIEQMSQKLIENVQKISQTGTQSELSASVDETLTSLTELADFIRELSAWDADVEKRIFNLRVLQDTVLSVADVIETSKNGFSKRKSSVVPMRTEKGGDIAATVDNCRAFISSLKDLSVLPKGVEEQSAKVTYAVWLKLGIIQIETIQRKLKNEVSTEESSAMNPRGISELVHRIKQMIEKGHFSNEAASQHEVHLFINSAHDVIAQVAQVKNAEIRETLAKNLINYFENQNLILQSDQVDSAMHSRLKLSVNSLMELASYLESIAERPPTSLKPPVPVRTSSRSSSISTISSVSDDLHHAAKEIQQAADRLKTVQPRRSVYIPNEFSDDDEEDDDAFASASPMSTDFDESILEACRAIMQISAQLIPAAAAAQSELNATSMLTHNHFDEGHWTSGFNLAARAVGSSCQKLCDAASALMSGTGTEEKLVSAAKQVAGFTAQLLVASKVKGNPNSLKMKALLHVGHGVRKASEELVKIIKKGSRNVNEETLIEEARKTVVIDKRLVGGIAQEIKINEKVMLKEKELADAQKKLIQARKAKYAGVSSGPTASDELAIQELVLVKERELAEARAILIAIRDLKYHNREADDYTGYGQDTLSRKSKAPL